MKKVEKQQEPQKQALNIPDVIGWRDIVKLFLFRYKNTKYDLGTRIALSILCWLSIIWLVIIIMAVKIVFACL